jgi:hypothetical protein
MPEQTSFWPAPEFSPLLPPRGTKAEQALDDLLTHEYITQIDWLKSGKGWRLSAAVKVLDYLGWQPTAIQVKVDGWPAPVALYSLSKKAKQAAFKLRGCSDASQ